MWIVTRKGTKFQEACDAACTFGVWRFLRCQLSDLPSDMTLGENIRVQALVEQGITEVPKQFLGSKVEEPPNFDASNPASVTEQVPVIDLAGTMSVLQSSCL